MEGNRIPLKEYAALAKAFNPILFDPMGRFPVAATSILDGLKAAR